MNAGLVVVADHGQREHNEPVVLELHLGEDLGLECIQELLCEALLRLQPLCQHGHKPCNFAEAQHHAMTGQVAQVAPPIKWEEAGLRC